MSDDLEWLRKMNADDERIRVLVACVISACVVIGLVIAVAYTPDPATAQQVLREAGWSEGVVTESGSLTMRCGSGDAIYYRLRAKNPKGEMTEVTVCCGIFKDCTMRY